MVIQSALQDPRFSPLLKEEVCFVDIELSILTPFKPLPSVDDIVIGRHGLLLKKSYHSGVLLPQVPVEWGWTVLEFLEHTSKKAGLERDGWKGSSLFYLRFYVYSLVILYLCLTTISGRVFKTLEVNYSKGFST